MYQSIEIKADALKKFKQSFYGYEKLYSLFFKVSDVSYTITREEKEWPILYHFLSSSSFEKIKPHHIESVSFNNAKKYTLLNKHQFEGSLITNLLHGGCYGSNVESTSEARLIAANLVDEFFTDEHNWPFIFSMPSDWSDWSNYWAITWAYIIYDPSNNRWWYLSFGSTS